MPAVIECRFRHRFSTAAKPGGTTGCPDCRREGRRTSVRVPVGTASTRAPRPPADSGETARLAAAWSAEAPAAYNWRRTPTQPSRYECGKCGGPMVWHSAHTALACLGCPTSIISPGAVARGEVHAEALARRRGERQGAELAVIDPHAEARARASRVELHRAREALKRYLGKMLAVCDGRAHDRVQFTRLGFEIGATLRGYAAEIDRADNTETLTAIAREIGAIHDDGDYQRLADEAERVRERREYAEQLADAEQARAEQLAEAERQAEAERRRATAEARELAAAQRRQLPAARTSAPAYASKNGYLMLAEQVALMVHKHQTRKKAETERRERNGTCGWCDATAGRIYGISNHYRNAAVNPQFPNAKACPDHYATADTWIEQQRQQWGWTAYYWELDAA